MPPFRPVQDEWPRNALLVCLMSALFIGLAYMVVAERASHFDRKVFRVMERADSTPVAILAYAGRILGYVVVAFMIPLALWGVKRRDTAAIASLLSMAGSVAVSCLLILGRREGWFYNRADPATALDHLFPDVHILVAVVACGLPTQHLPSPQPCWCRVLVAACTLGLIGWIALGWLVTNVVYGTDILGGTLLGGIWWRLCLLVDSRRLFWREERS